MQRLKLPLRVVLVAGLLLLHVGCGRGQQAMQGSEPAEASAGADIAALVPDTEIFLADLSWQDAQPRVAGLRNITNRPGYDNQPKFLPDGESLLFTSIHDDAQSDIYRYLITEQQIVPYVITDESEYSPTPIPGSGAISVVRVEYDGTQRLWRIPAANAAPQLLLPDITGVGYHAWLDEDTLALFIVAEPSLLVLAELASGRSAAITENIGRSLARMPGDAALAFIDKQDEGVWRVARYDLVDGSLSDVVDTPVGSEDFAWSRNGGLFMGSGSRLLYWDGHAGSEWRQVAGFPDDFEGRITRIDVADDLEKLAFVAEVE